MNQADSLLNLCENKSVSVFSKSKRPRSLVQYAQAGLSDSPTTKTHEKLDPGIYKIDSTMGGIKFVKHFLDTDELLRFEDKRYNEILDEIAKFWTLKEKYADLGFTHKRGIVVYGKPGCGKSCLLKLVMEDVINNGDIVFMANTQGGGIYTLTQGLKTFKEVEPDRKALVVMEDIDEGIGFQEKAFLDLLDGDQQVDNILYLATSNYINKLPPRFLRPGRFDRKLEIHNPPKSGRLAYFQAKRGLNEKDDVLEELADMTDGFTFAQLREFLVGHYILGDSKKKVIERIKKGLEESFNESFLSEDIGGINVTREDLIFKAQKMLTDGSNDTQIRNRLRIMSPDSNDNMLDRLITVAKEELGESFQNGKEKKFVHISHDEDGVPIAAQLITVLNETNK